MLPFRLDKLFEIEMELSVKAVSECEPVKSSRVLLHIKNIVAVALLACPSLDRELS